MKKLALLTLMTLVSCASHERSPAAIAASEVSCLKLHQSIQRQINDLFEVHHFNGYSDMPEGIVEVAESLDNQGINYRFIRKTDEDQVGIEILPDDHGPINRYVKNISQRFDGVRVFYLDVPESRILGSFTPSKNYIYLGKKVITDLNGAGYTTLSHEARHAYFTARILRYMESAYKGQITATKGIINGSEETFGYTTYMSFQEIKTFREDSRNVFALWKKELIDQRKHNQVFWKKYKHKINAAKKFTQVTKDHLEKLMASIIDDSVEFKTRLGVVNVSKTIQLDEGNTSIISIALNSHHNLDEITPALRQELKENAIQQVNRELDQLFIDETILSSQQVFKDEIESFTEHAKAVLFTKYAHKNTLVHAREIRHTRVQELVNQFYHDVFKAIVAGQNIVDDNAALSSFAELIRRSEVVETASGYRLTYLNNQFELLFDREGVVTSSRFTPAL